MGNTKAETKARHDLILFNLKGLARKKLRCPAFGRGAYVIVLPESIDEIAWHAAKSPSSTVIALHVAEYLSVAEKVGTDKPKRNKQSRPPFSFSRIYILKGTVHPYGTAKITIGKQTRGAKILYCITDIKKVAS